MEGCCGIGACGSGDCGVPYGLCGGTYAWPGFCPELAGGGGGGEGEGEGYGCPGIICSEGSTP